MSLFQHRGATPVRDRETPEIRESFQLPVPVKDGGAPDGTPQRPFLGRLLERARRLVPKNALMVMLRMLQRRTITVNVQDGCLRVVVLKGRTVTAWGMSVASESLPRSGDAEEQIEGIADQLRALLEELPPRHGRLVTCLPIYTPLIRQLRLPRIGRRYISQVVFSEVLETIPFSEDQVDITWRRRRAGAWDEIVAVAVPREDMDRHVALLKEAGSRPGAAYAWATSLAAAGGVSDAILVDMELLSAALVLLREGVPRGVHRVELPGRDADPQARAEAVVRAVEQVGSYDQMANPDTEDVRLPAVFTGRLTTDATPVEALEATLGRDVLPFAPPLVYPGSFPAHEYAANLGMALSDMGRIGLFRGKGTPANLIPERHRVRPMPLLPFLVFAILAAFLYVASINGARVEDALYNQATLSSRVATLEGRERSLNLSLMRGDVLRGRIEEATRLASEMESTIQGQGREMETLLRQLEVITVEALPPGVHLSTLLLQNNGFVLSGTGPSYEDVLRYSEGLRAPGVFADVQVARVEMSGTAGAVSNGYEQDAAAVTFQIIPSLAVTRDAGTP